MKLIFVATTFMLHGIASTKIAQMLCNNKPPLSQWGPANCSEDDHWTCYSRCQKECPVERQPSVASIGYVRSDGQCDCYCWV
ncbi:hypothetical protein RB213_013801 [Colletotrichum asianum]|uniref:Uncharacterized protein n=1 Tax=Colletotrichum asianum TaxID=702518 RepID=A0A8H3WCB6_9PEZI|nr:hypothetical protein GQ607_008413 [Colletotrichum asianum]